MKRDADLLLVLSTSRLQRTSTVVYGGTLLSSSYSIVYSYSTRSIIIVASVLWTAMDQIRAASSVISGILREIGA